jgi:hypothetical protein
MTTTAAELDWLTRARPTVLVFVPHTRELRRFVLSGAFDVLAQDRRLHYVLPADRAEAMAAEGGAAVAAGWSAVDIDAPGTIVELVDRHQPLYCIVPASLDDPLCQAVLRVCEAEDVSVLVLQAEWGDLAGQPRIHGATPYIGCWGRQSQEHGKAIQRLDGRDLAALGAPHLDTLGPRARVADGQRTLLVVDAPEVQAGDATIVRHASSASDDRELFELIAASDAVAAPVSGVLLASLILEKPTMALAFAGGAGMDAELRESAALVWCDRADRVAADCSRLFEPVDEETARKARRLLLNRALTRQPGTYAERLAGFCRSTIDNQAKKQRARRTGAKQGTNSNSYGALLIARTYCGIAQDGGLTVPGHWMHGWQPAFHSLDPLLVAYHKVPGQVEGHDFAAQIEREREDTPQWVSRADQAEYLAGHGYRHVRAIGLPIAYVPKAGVPRVPGSLLVMPPHGHLTHGPDDPVAGRYADAIADIAGRFSHVRVGISEDDVARQQWTESFRRRGIEVFTTADLGDPNTLVRLHRILSTFEYVTTNGFGSQIAFAAHCGAKVSVFGPFAEFPLERLRTTHVVKIDPRFLETMYYLCTEEALRQAYPFLFVEPDRAIVRQEWGDHEVGTRCTVAPDALRRLFGWEAARTPQLSFTS